jgi:hypothetical protein
MRLLEANEVKEGRARVTLLTRSLGGVWQPQTASDWASDTAGVEVETDVLLLTGDARSVAAEGLALTLSPYRLNTLSPLTGVKSVNYLEHVIAREEAGARGFDEAVVLNERGEIVSATMANLFWVKRGTIRTPALATGALAGTTRACTIALAAELAFPLVEGIYDTSDLGDADEIFLTSAALGIALSRPMTFIATRSPPAALSCVSAKPSGNSLCAPAKKRRRTGRAGSAQNERSQTPPLPVL